MKMTLYVHVDEQGKLQIDDLPYLAGQFVTVTIESGISASAETQGIQKRSIMERVNNTQKVLGKHLDAIENPTAFLRDVRGTDED